MLMPFPTELPIEAIGLIVDRIRGKAIALPVALNAAWNLAGYAATQIPATNEEQPVYEYPVSDDEVISLLENLSELQNLETEQPVKLGIIPWVIILKICVKLLATFA